ncbi:hypothetical protein ATY30_26955 [Sinorhizobium americanum]|nr:hypothetical protein ATY30_26955 [Sinorhizobium americanum]
MGMALPRRLGRRLLLKPNFIMTPAAYPSPACSRLEHYESTVEIFCPIDVAATLGESATESDWE